ncbi:hypothetical protein FOMPIDRAFT_1054808 [Fomitopsis schrenkii]|uniref:F-box domain-containing protein n=1 Tax=Fomitopsis schrenkii TaxID=2126942 RepID=S8F7E6_FOMSC|nr:hypothetical protein FOMPIDRAFT_1054808 [Fomitopsis schrenkii]
MDSLGTISRRTFTPESLSSARESLEGEISYHLRCLEDLKARLNTLTYISNLPSELLREVFFHLAGSRGCGRLQPANWRKGHPYRWIRVTHVCKQWREVALSCPALWSHIAVTTRRELMTALLERSRALPLSVALAPDPDQDSRHPYDAHPYDAYPYRRPTTNTMGTAELILSQLRRIRTLWISVDPEHTLSLLRLLESPAPLLESLLITGHDNASANKGLQSSINLLLRRPDSHNLRQLHLQTFTLEWDVVASLPNLTHLTLERVKIQLDALLRTLAHTLLLQELTLISCRGNMGFMRDDDADAEPALAAIHTPIPLHQLRQLWVEDTLAFCSRLLRRLETPTLRKLYVVEAPELFGSSHALEFLASLGPKIKTLGKLQTASFENTNPKDSYAPHISHICVHATRRRMCEKRASRLSYVSEALAGQADLVLRLLLDDADSRMALCQALPLNDIRCLLLANMVKPWKSILGRHATEVTHLHYQGLDASPCFHPPPETIPGDETSHHRAFPHLHVLTLHEPHFDVDSPRRLVPRLRPPEDKVLDLFISRYEAGTEIERLRLVRPYQLQDAQLTRLREVIRFVEVHHADEDSSLIPGKAASKYGSGYVDRLSY